jgi:hypothetical protein
LRLTYRCQKFGYSTLFPAGELPAAKTLAFEINALKARFGGSPRIHAGEGAASALRKSFEFDHAL